MRYSQYTLQVYSPQFYWVLHAVSRLGQQAYYPTTVKNRKILYAKNTSNIAQASKKPRFIYSSCMHGNETAMYVNMLRFMDYLLKSYSSDAYVKKMIDSVEIWICPLENPDGTYAAGDNSVSGATNFHKFSGIDLHLYYLEQQVILQKSKSLYFPAHHEMLLFD